MAGLQKKLNRLNEWHLGRGGKAANSTVIVKALSGDSCFEQQIFTGNWYDCLPGLTRESRRSLHHAILVRDLKFFWKQAAGFMKEIGKAPNRDRFWSHFLLDVRKSKIGFLDIETCGFSGMPVFLVGILLLEKGSFRVQQHLAISEEGEPAILKSTLKSIKGLDTIFTFNGKRFDLPFLEGRLKFFQLPSLPAIKHFDVLEGARKWKANLPNLKLQTLERVFCKRIRSGDISGANIPWAYARFLQDESDAGDFLKCIHHNAQDIIALGEIAFLLAGIKNNWTTIR